MTCWELSLRRCVVITLVSASLIGCGPSSGAEDASASDGGSDAATSAACGGPRPDFADCSGGFYRLDCGGEGPPTLGCTDHCYWFATACMPEGFVASDCPAANLCCHPSGSGTWPFPDSWRPQFHDSQVVEDVVALRGGVVSATAPETITVAIDPRITAPTTSSVTCDPGIELELCDSARLQTAWVGDSFGIGIDPTRVNRQHTIVDVVPTSATTAFARMFVVLEPDTALTAAELPPRCEAAHGPPQPTVTGTLTLSGLSRTTPIHGHAELTLNGLPATFVF